MKILDKARRTTVLTTIKANPPFYLQRVSSRLFLVLAGQQVRDDTSPTLPHQALYAYRRFLPAIIVWKQA
jgi:hypothetical protein